jgi:hypothetical protein
MTTRHGLLGLSAALIFGTAACGMAGGSSAYPAPAATGSPGPTAGGSSSTTGSSTGSGTGSAPGVFPSETVTTGSAGVTGASGSTGAPVTTGASGVTGAAGSTGAAGTGGAVPTPNLQSGSLTAGTWDDNLNFDFYLRYLKNMEGQQLPGMPLIARASRMEVRATDGEGTPLPEARITISGANGKLFESSARADGRLFFFPGPYGVTDGTPLMVTAAVGQATATVNATVGDATVNVAVPGAIATPPAALDLALVIDTTGSMGDELDYLKVEMRDIVSRVSSTYPGVAQRWALILYRDDGDEYVVRSFDFTNTLTTFQANLSAQSAGGGGDIPEAPDRALAKLTSLSWSPGAVARMAFWVADAPHHQGREATMMQDILMSQALGVRIYPIAASGTEDLLEYTMRTAAEVTGGRYLFLTNDSGIGFSHKEPTIPCYFVTSLNRAMYRMIDMELTGSDKPPAAADILRTGGDPQNGRCTLTNGQQVSIL